MHCNITRRIGSVKQLSTDCHQNIQNIDDKFQCTLNATKHTTFCNSVGCVVQLWIIIMSLYMQQHVQSLSKHANFLLVYHTHTHKFSVFMHTVYLTHAPYLRFHALSHAYIPILSFYMHSLSHTYQFSVFMHCQSRSHTHIHTNSELATLGFHAQRSSLFHLSHTHKFSVFAHITFSPSHTHAHQFSVFPHTTSVKMYNVKYNMSLGKATTHSIATEQLHLSL